MRRCEVCLSNLHLCILHSDIIDPHLRHQELLLLEVVFIPYVAHDRAESDRIIKWQPEQPRQPGNQGTNVN